jgi:hypothetical protein
VITGSSVIPELAVDDDFADFGRAEGEGGVLHDLHAEGLELRGFLGFEHEDRAAVILSDGDAVDSDESRSGGNISHDLVELGRESDSIVDGERCDDRVHGFAFLVDVRQLILATAPAGED